MGTEEETGGSGRERVLGRTRGRRKRDGLRVWGGPRGLPVAGGGGVRREDMQEGLRDGQATGWGVC